MERLLSALTLEPLAHGGAGAPHLTCFTDTLAKSTHPNPLRLFAVTPSFPLKDMNRKEAPSREATRAAFLIALRHQHFVVVASNAAVA